MQVQQIPSQEVVHCPLYHGRILRQKLINQSLSNLDREQDVEIPDDFDQTQSMGIIPTPQMPRNQNYYPDQSFSSKDDESVMSEHEIRLSRSFDMLDIPDWYRESPRHDQEIVMLDNAHRRDLTTDRPGSSFSNSSKTSTNSKPVVIQHRVVTPVKLRTPDSSRVSTPVGGPPEVQLPSQKIHENQKELPKMEVKELHVKIDAVPQKPKTPAKEAYLKLKEEKWKDRSHLIDPELVSDHLQALHDVESMPKCNPALTVAYQTIYETSHEGSPVKYHRSMPKSNSTGNHRVTFKSDDSSSDPLGDSAYASSGRDSEVGNSPDGPNSGASEESDKWYTALH